jgi:hypothetical protein
LKGPQADGFETAPEEGCAHEGDSGGGDGSAVFAEPAQKSVGKQAQGEQRSCGTEAEDEHVGSAGDGGSGGHGLKERGVDQAAGQEPEEGSESEAGRESGALEELSGAADRGDLDELRAAEGAEHDDAGDQHECAADEGGGFFYTREAAQERERLSD